MQLHSYVYTHHNNLFAHTTIHVATYICAYHCDYTYVHAPPNLLNTPFNIANDHLHSQYVA